jgi:hypothetical protein
MKHLFLYSRLPDPLPTVERSPDDSSLGSGLPPEPCERRGIDRHPRCYSASVRMRSVDDWPLAKILIQISGGKPESVAVDPSM